MSKKRYNSFKPVSPSATEKLLQQNPHLDVVNTNLGGNKEKPNPRFLKILGAVAQLRQKGLISGISTDLQYQSDRDTLLARSSSKFGSHVLTAATLFLRSKPELNAYNISHSLHDPSNIGQEYRELFPKAIEHVVKGAANLLKKDKILFKDFDFKNMEWNDQVDEKFVNFLEKQNELNEASGKLIKEIYQTYQTNPGAVYLYLLEKMRKISYYNKLRLYSKQKNNKKYLIEKIKNRNIKDFDQKIETEFYRNSFQHQYFLRAFYDVFEMPVEKKFSEDIPFKVLGKIRLLKGGWDSRREKTPRDADVTVRKEDYEPQYNKEINRGRQKSEEIHKILRTLFKTGEGKNHLSNFSKELANLTYRPQEIDTKGLESYSIKSYIENRSKDPKGVHDLFRTQIMVTNPTGLKRNSQQLIQAVDSWIKKKTNNEYGLENIKDRFKNEDPKGRQQISFSIAPIEKKPGLPEIETQIHHLKDYMKVQIKEHPHFLMKGGLRGTSSLGIIIDIPKKPYQPDLEEVLLDLHKQHAKLVMENPSRNGIDHFYLHKKQDRKLMKVIRRRK